MLEGTDRRKFMLQRKHMEGNELKREQKGYYFGE